MNQFCGYKSDTRIHYPLVHKIIVHYQCFNIYVAFMLRCVRPGSGLGRYAGRRRNTFEADVSLSEDTSDLQAVSKRDRRPKHRLLSLRSLDKRTAASRSARETRDRICADLGGEGELSTLQTALVDAAAVTAVMLADLRLRWLRGEDTIEVTAIATLQNTFNRTAAMLGLNRQARDLVPDLRRYLDERQPAAVQEPDEHGATGAKSESAKPSQDTDADTGPPREIHENALNDREPAQNPLRISEKNSVGENSGKNPSVEGS
jgi:hypothetical protein